MTKLSEYRRDSDKRPGANKRKGHKYMWAYHRAKTYSTAHT